MKFVETSSLFTNKKVLPVNANPSVIDDSAVFAPVANISVRLTSAAKTAASKNHSAIFQPPRHHLFAAPRARAFFCCQRSSFRPWGAHKRSPRERQTGSGAEGECDPLAHTHTHTKRHASGNAQYFGFDLLDWLDVHSFQLATCLPQRECARAHVPIAGMSTLSMHNRFWKHFRQWALAPKPQHFPSVLCSPTWNEWWWHYESSTNVCVCVVIVCFYWANPFLVPVDWVCCGKFPIGPNF